MKEQIPWKKIYHHLKNGEAKFDESFTAWLEEDQSNRVFWEEARLMYSITGELPEVFTPDIKQAWFAVEGRIALRGSKFFRNQVFTRIAASIILVLLGAVSVWMGNSLLHTPQYSEVYSPFGHKTLVILPDSSKVWLNGDTRLRYETNFFRGRNVEVAGEALFDVQKDNGNLFVVKTGAIEVEVYGTKFNVKHYPDASNVEVALLEGSIGLFNKDEFLRNISPGEVANFNSNTSKLQITKENVKRIISWSTDELIIENEKFEEVIKYLERWYGVEIKLDGSIYPEKQLSFKVKTETLYELLSIIDRVSPINYKIDGKTVIITKRETN